MIENWDKSSISTTQETKYTRALFQLFFQILKCTQYRPIYIYYFYIHIIFLSLRHTFSNLEYNRFIKNNVINDFALIYLRFWQLPKFIIHATCASNHHARSNSILGKATCVLYLEMRTPLWQSRSIYRYNDFGEVQTGLR